MARFLPAPAEVHAALERVRLAHHPGLGHLSAAVVMAQSPGELPVAKARPTTPHQRAAGLADVVLTIDHEAWASRSDAGRVAALDHALCGVRAVMRGHLYALDAAGRPRAVRRRFDIPGVGYAECWRRHHARSVEAENARMIRDASRGIAAE